MKYYPVFKNIIIKEYLNHMQRYLLVVVKQKKTIEYAVFIKEKVKFGRI